MNQTFKINHNAKNNSSAVQSQNKIYKKEMNSLIEKIVKSKRNTFKFSKQVHNNNNQNQPQTQQQQQQQQSQYQSHHQSHHQQPQLQMQLSPKTKASNLIIIQPLTLPQQKISKEIKTIKVVDKSTISRASKTQMTEIDNSLMGELSTKVSEYTKLAIAYNKSNHLVKPTFLPELLSFVKQERNTSSLIENDDFFYNLIQMMKHINFAAPKYHLTDSNYNPVEDALVKTIIEEVKLSEDNGLIRIKNENWVDILNLYEIFIELLNDFNATELLIDKLPKDFLQLLISSFQTLDVEIRMIIKLIIYKIYSCSLIYRNDTIKFLKFKIIDITQDTSQQIYFLGELLELLRCIIQGASKPISDKFLNIISTVICPILKTSYMKSPSLKDTLLKLANFDDKIGITILAFLSITWPIRYPERILVYLDIIESILIAIGVRIKDDPIMLKILKKIKLCFVDLSFLIADRSLIFFKNDYFYSLLYLYNLQLPSLEMLVKNISSHWSQEIKLISRIAISKLFKKDEKLMTQLSNEEIKIIDDFKLDINESEDIWDIHFNLKGD